MERAPELDAHCLQQGCWERYVLVLPGRHHGHSGSPDHVRAPVNPFPRVGQLSSGRLEVEDSWWVAARK